MYIGNLPNLKRALAPMDTQALAQLDILAQVVHVPRRCRLPTTAMTTSTLSTILPLILRVIVYSSLRFLMCHHVHSFGTSHRRRRRRRRVVRVRALAPSGHLLNSMLNRPISKLPLARLLEVCTCQL